MPRTKPDAESVQPAPPNRVEAAQARADAAQAAVDRATSNITEAERRLAEAEGSYKAAAEAAGRASLAVLEDPDAETLLEDATLEMTRIGHRREMLRTNTVPAAKAALPPREEELGAALLDLRDERLRAAIITKLMPVDRAVMAAWGVVMQAIKHADNVRAEIAREFPQEYGQHYYCIATPEVSTPTRIAEHCKTRFSSGLYVDSPTQHHHLNTGVDLIESARALFNIGPEEVA